MTDITERYAAPTASVVLEPPRTQLWRTSLWLMALFMVLSFGFYPAIWLFRRRHALNAIEAPYKVWAWPPLLLFGLVAFQFVAAVVRGVTTPGVVEPGLLEGGAQILRIGVGIVLLVQMFFVKSILEDQLAEQAGHDNRFDASFRTLSSVMTFFFSVFYLQYVINRDIVRPRR